MAYEMKPDTGSLFKNDRREKDTQAHARGSALIDGVEYWVDAWTNESANGTKYQSLKFKRKEYWVDAWTNESANKRKDTVDRDQQHRDSLNRGGNTPADLDDEMPF